MNAGRLGAVEESLSILHTIVECQLDAMSSHLPSWQLSILIVVFPIIPTSIGYVLVSILDVYVNELLPTSIPVHPCLQIEGATTTSKPYKY